MSLDPATRRERARLGGLARSARYDPLEVTAAATKASQVDRFVREVDPDLTLPEPERLRRAAAARRLYMARLAYKSHAARRRRKMRADAAVASGGANVQADLFAIGAARGPVLRELVDELHDVMARHELSQLPAEGRELYRAAWRFVKAYDPIATAMSTGRRPEVI